MLQLSSGQKWKKCETTVLFIAMHYRGYTSLEVKGWWGLLLPSCLLITAVQQPGTSSPPSRLKRSSTGVIWMCKASFTNNSCPLPWSSTVLFHRCHLDVQGLLHQRRVSPPEVLSPVPPLGCLRLLLLLFPVWVGRRHCGWSYHPQCLRPTHTGNSRRKQPRGGTGEGTSGGDILCGWDEWGHQACLQEV